MNQEEGAFWSMLTYFDCIKVPVIARAIDLMEQGVIKDKTNLQFATDMVSTVMRIYAHYNDEEVFKIANFGKYFPAVCEDPLKYI